MMSDSHLKLYYFTGKGRGEVPRLLFIAAGKTFEDIRFEWEDWIKTYKPKSPFGQAPYLEIEGKVYAQMVAISVYLAREYGFYGQTNLERLQIDQIVQLYQDFVGPCQDAYDMDECPERLEKLKKFKEEKSPPYLAIFDRLLKENGTDYFVGNSLTLADFFVFDVFTGFLKDYLNEGDITPRLKKHTETIMAHPKIGPYVASRKPTPY